MFEKLKISIEQNQYKLCQLKTKDQLNKETIKYILIRIKKIQSFHNFY
jgi:hypothetical protein